MPPLQQYYQDQLIQRVRTERHPSHQILNRIEATLWTPEQIVDYVGVLLEKLEQQRYPSHQLLDRIERMLMLAARA